MIGVLHGGEAKGQGEKGVGGVVFVLPNLVRIGCCEPFFDGVLVDGDYEAVEVGEEEA